MTGLSGWMSAVSSPKGMEMARVRSTVARSAQRLVMNKRRRAWGSDLKTLEVMVSSSSVSL